VQTLFYGGRIFPDFATLNDHDIPLLQAGYILLSSELNSRDMTHRHVIHSAAEKARDNRDCRGSEVCYMEESIIYFLRCDV
jgi:hypothetical protein